ncbi:AAA ATPase [Boothiomyces macroporosus]|uniref:Cell division control protein n=1 Tax=Boothiomyces macroporosus TaxID=261099 RepID=A0AAD5UBU7_9FUNG|nr:AAA ATPase [Boothiomyces macroporosus]
MKTRSGKRALEEVPLSRLDTNQSTPKKPKISIDHLTPTKKELKSQNETPKRTPLKILQEAKAAFRRCATPKKLIGRESERQKLNCFIDEHVTGQKSGSLYISGCPGTGKTALLNEILQQREKAFRELPFTVKYAFINCMNITDAKNIYSTLADKWKLSGSASLTKELVKSRVVPLLVLDEIDNLITRDQDELYTLFEWAKMPNSRLVMIGIANALDLTSRFLPRLQSKNYEPEYLSFNPYQIKEIAAIIKDRLMTLDEPDEPASPIKPNGKQDLPIMQPMAVELAARKLAGTGDLRKALDVCRMAIQMVENEEKSQENSLIIPKVTVKHVLSAASSMLGASSNSRIDKLQMQSKLVLSTVYLMIKTKQKDLSVRKVEESYRTICSYQSQVGRVEKSEFNDIITQLDTLGLITLGYKRGQTQLSEAVVGLNIQPDEIVNAVSKKKLS